MADKKISELTNITGANLANADEFVVVDSSADQTKAITFGELKEAFDTGTGFVRITGDTMTGDLNFGDNVKAVFGAGSDLQIYHESSTGNSRIVESGSGHLNIEASNLNLKTPSGENYINCNDNGSVVLRYDNAQKIATTSTGADVTGTLTSDGLTLETDNASIDFTGDTGNNFINAKQGLRIDIDNDDDQGATSFGITHGGGTANIFNANESGDISFYEDTGTTAKLFWDASAESLGIGTSSPQHTLDFATSASGHVIRVGDDNTTAYMSFSNPRGFVGFDGVAASMRIQAGTTKHIIFATGESTFGSGERVRITDTGNVGIGTSSPSAKLTLGSVSAISGTSVPSAPSSYNMSIVGTNINTTGNYTSGISFEESSSTRAAILTYDDGGSGDSGLAFATQGSGTIAQRMTIDSSGNVGIGTSSPVEELHVYSDNAPVVLIEAAAGNDSRLRLLSPNDRTGFIEFGDSDDVDTGEIRYDHSTNNMVFSTNGTSEAMRIDSSGNLLVGKSSQDFGATGGFEFYGANGDSLTIISRDDNHPLELRRNTTDGDIVKFIKGGTTVGSIGSSNSDLMVGNSDVGLKFHDANDKIYPWNVSTDAIRDGAITLGDPAGRFNNLYLSGGVYLGGTGSANKLDDYETGTWTPSFNFDIGGSGITYGNRSGYYTKVGNLVTIIFTIEVTGGVTSSDYFLRLALPFTTTNVGNAFGRVSVQNTSRSGFNVAISAGNNDMLCFATNGLTDYARGDDVPSGTYVGGSITYRTT